VDIQFFLFQRLEFIEQFYKNSAAPFVERKRKIEGKEEPFVPPYGEDGESPFLAKWIEADESLNVLGRSCISMLAASVHLYLKTWERQIGIPVNESLKPCFKKNGWFHGYKAYFAKHPVFASKIASAIYHYSKSSYWPGTASGIPRPLLLTARTILIAT
jgi:hypothetical protein